MSRIDRQFITRLGVLLIGASAGVVWAFAQTSRPLPPVPPPPPSPPGLHVPAIRPPPLPESRRPLLPPGQFSILVSTNRVPIAASPTPVFSKPSAVSPTNLVWEAEIKEIQAKAGQSSAHLTFGVTNISAKPILIKMIRTSCGCTVAKLPMLPFKLEPAKSARMEVAVDLRGKRGQLTKLISLDTSAGVKLLTVRINIPDEVRARNLMMATADRQAVFKNQCAACHLTPAEDKTGGALYAAACGICHESPHRASMVPDLRFGPKGRDLRYWTQWIRHGKPGSLMPAFAQSEQGPLTDAQIASLAEFLDAKFSALSRSVAGPPERAYQLR